MVLFLRSSSLKYFGIAAGVIVLFTFQARAQIINELLQRISNHRENVSTLSADLLLGRFDPALKEWDHSKGKLLMAGKGRSLPGVMLRIDFEEPRNESYLIASGTFYAYTPSLKQVYTGAINAKTIQEKSNDFFGFLAMSKIQMQANFSVKYIGNEKIGGVPTTHLAFIPKRVSKLKSADIWADPDGLVRQGKMTASSGDENYIRLSNIQENIKINTDRFALKLPKDVKVTPISTRPTEVTKKLVNAVNKPKTKVKRHRRLPAKPSRLKSRTSKPII